ncbi:MAG: hypothetical protein KF900_02885 [Bacteroidetes bacterium]|nr:hypothetical protein [Bacteroidota bacterium]
MKTYRLKNAATFNITKTKFNLIASPATLGEIKVYKDFFGFDFEKLFLQKHIVYKLHIENQPEQVIQGFVAFKPSIGILLCKNMEVNNINKKPNPLYGNIGKAMIALCCKYSFDNDMDGFIGFEAKNKLFDYYKRFGAEINPYQRNGMIIQTENAKKLIDLYF